MRGARRAGVLHVGHDGPAEGCRARRVRRRPGRKLAQQGQVALWGWLPDDVYMLSGPAYHAGAGRLRHVGAVRRRDHGDPAALGRARVAPAGRAPSRHVELHDARALHPHPRGPGSRARAVRPVDRCGSSCTAPRRARSRSSTGSSTALPATEIWELYGASEGGATRISPTEWLARPGSVGRAVARRRDAHPRRGRRSRADRASKARSTSAARAARASTTTTSPTRPRRRGATARSPSATSATSTTTATCSSPTASPTWSSAAA